MSAPLDAKMTAAQYDEKHNTLHEEMKVAGHIDMQDVGLTKLAPGNIDE
jgi:hypothetical protein